MERIQVVPDDDIVTGRARQGDREAFQVLVERHARPVFRLAFRMTGTETDAEDIVQETFLKAWKQIGRFDGRASFGTWLHRIAANCALDQMRRRKRLGSADEAERQIPTAAPSPERLAASSQISALLGSALNELSGMERAAFILRHFEGMSIEEISAALKVPPGAAKHSVFRAVRKLRRALRPAMSASQ